MTGIVVPELSILKVALVTGGSRGIGKATAARLAALGTAVVVGYKRNHALATEVVCGLQSAGTSPCDFRSPMSPPPMMSRGR